MAEHGGLVLGRLPNKGQGRGSGSERTQKGSGVHSRGRSPADLIFDRAIGSQHTRRVLLSLPGPLIPVTTLAATTSPPSSLIPRSSRARDLIRQITRRTACKSPRSVRVVKRGTSLAAHQVLQQNTPAEPGVARRFGKPLRAASASTGLTFLRELHPPAFDGPESEVCTGPIPKAARAFRLPATHGGLRDFQQHPIHASGAHATSSH